MRKQGKSSILLVYMGGTIGMKQDPEDLTLKPFDFRQIEEEVPEIHKFALRTDTVTFDPLIDSSDVEPAVWTELAELLRDRYDRYDGFVVLHGTDTMAYSASALSFMLEDLAKPVIFTGSQLPIGVPRTDGKENFISSVEIAAAKDGDGRPLVPEVCIYFNSLLMRGNRCTKVSADGFRAFDSPNYPCLAEAGIDIRYRRQFIRRPAAWDRKLRIHSRLDTRVGILKLHPGLTRQSVADFLQASCHRAVILETYGSGNAPAKDWFVRLVAEAAAAGKIIVNVTQCLGGRVDMGRYPNGKRLADAGVIDGHDGTTESALAKLFCLMGESEDNEWVKERMCLDLKGEISG